MTVEEVQAVAKKYFGEKSDDWLTVAVLDPQALDTATQRKPAVAVRH